ncbi:hypothetical protein WJX77_007380 [Trebouxia sp. C0004]
MIASVRTNAKGHATEVDVATMGGGPGGLPAAAAVSSAFSDTLSVQVYQIRKRPVAIGWHECRQVLFDQLPPSTVEFDKQMTHYLEDDNGIVLYIDIGQTSVHAKVLVGADGYFAKVRAQCLDDGPPTFNEAVLWRARVGWQEGMPGSNSVVKYTLPGMHMWSPASESRGALVMPMRTMESTRDKGWTWILMAPMADVQKAGVQTPMPGLPKPFKGTQLPGLLLSML